MSSRLTYRRPSWSQGEWPESPRMVRGREIQSLPYLQGPYSTAIAEHVEFCVGLIRDQRDQPNGQDIRKTLRAIIDRPNGPDVSLLDEQTYWAMVEAATKTHQSIELESLSPDALSSCARFALDALKGVTGHPSTDWIAVRLVRGLMAIADGQLCKADEQTLLHEALVACGLGASAKNIERLRSAAGRLV
jgi:hypothetical protein